MTGQEALDLIDTDFFIGSNINETVKNIILSFLPTDEDVFLMFYKIFFVKKPSSTIEYLNISKKIRAKLSNEFLYFVNEIKPYDNFINSVIEDSSTYLDKFISNVNLFSRRNGLDFLFSKNLFLLYLRELGIINTSLDKNGNKILVTENDFKKYDDIFQKMYWNDSSLSRINQDEIISLIKDFFPSVFMFYYGYNPFNYIKKHLDEELMFHLYKKKYRYTEIDVINPLSDVRNKHLLILGIDRIIFNLSKVKKMKNQYEISSNFNDIFSSLPYINGFQNIFLNKGSELLATKNDMLILTNDTEAFVKEIINNSRFVFDSKNIKVIRDNYIFNTLKNSLSKLESSYKSVLGIASSELEALLYSKLQIPFYIVSTCSGFIDDDKKLLAIAQANQVLDFRSKFYYDIKSLSLTDKETKENLEYVTKIPVYFKKFLVGENFHNDKNNKIDGKNICNISRDEELNFDEFLYKNFDDFVKEFNDIDLNDDVLLCSIPTSDETIPNDDRIFRLLFDALIEENKSGINGWNYLRRREIKKINDEKYYDNIFDKIYIDQNDIDKIKDKTVYLFSDVLTDGADEIYFSELLYRNNAKHVVVFSLFRGESNNKISLNLLY